MSLANYLLKAYERTFNVIYSLEVESLAVSTNSSTCFIKPSSVFVLDFPIKV